MNNMSGILAIIGNLLSVISWMWVFLAYMEPVICKDASDRKKFFSKPLRLRFKIFYRSLHRTRYVADVLIWGSSLTIIIVKLTDLYSGAIPVLGFFRILASITVAMVFIIENHIRRKTKRKLKEILRVERLEKLKIHI